MVLFWWALAAVMVHTQTTIYGAEAKVVVSTAQGFSTYCEMEEKPSEVKPEPAEPNGIFETVES